MVQSSLSYNVNGAACPQLDVLEKHIAAIQPRWLLIMDNIGMAWDFKRKFPATNIIARNWALTNGDENVYAQLSPAAWLDKRQAEAANGTWLYTGNEAGVAPQWHIDLMKSILARNLDMRLVISNAAVGTPAVDEWKRPEMRELFNLLDAHRDRFVLGLHEYFGGIAPSGFVGGFPDGSWSDGRTNLHPNYENRANWPPDASGLMLWHCGRFKVVNDAAASFGVAPPRIVITEHGADDLGDMKPWAQKFPLTDGYTSHRGWKSLGGMWARLLPGRTMQEAYYENVRYLRTAVYDRFPNVEAQLLYTWSSSTQWAQFDMSEADTFRGLLEDDIKAMTPVVKPPLPDFPADFETRAQVFDALATNGSSNVRSKPSRDSDLLALIPAAATRIKAIDARDLFAVEVISETIGGKPGIWIPVQIGTALRGWVFGGYVTLSPVVSVPDVPSQSQPVTWSIAIAATYTGTVAEREASKQAWAGLADFIRQYQPSGQPVDVDVTEL